jgi:tol-pal system protein YbgF
LAANPAEEEASGLSSSLIFASPRSAPNQSPAPRPDTTRFLTTPSIAERTAYNAAFDQLREGNYNAAITGFQEFLQMYPNSGLVADTQYWLGETYYITRDFDKAKQAFITVGVNYPDSEKLPEAMLKLGYVYDELGDANKAREVLLKLTQTYPDSRAANLAKQRLQALR